MTERIRAQMGTVPLADPAAARRALAEFFGAITGEKVPGDVGDTDEVEVTLPGGPSSSTATRRTSRSLGWPPPIPT